MTRRRGMGVLAIVVLFCLVGGVLAMAAHSLWRGGSRTLFSVQERAELVNLARSAIAEASYAVQSGFDRNGRTAGDVRWFDWVTSAAAPAALTIAPEGTRAQVELVLPGSAALAYVVRDVAVTRVKPLDRADATAIGLVDIKAVVEVHRKSPAHDAVLSVTERRPCWLLDDVGPYAAAGRHVELAATAAATAVEGE